MPRVWFLINKIWRDQRGSSLVEALLAGSILLLLSTAFVGALLYGQESTVLAGNQGRATLLAEEGLEAVRNIQHAGWSNLVDGTYGLAISGNQWVLSGSSDITGAFTRQITITSIDGRRKDITSVVNWVQNPRRNGTVSLSARLTNWVVNPASWSTPARVGLFNNAGNNDGLKIQIQGNYAYVVLPGATPNFVVLNISNPTTPTLAGSMTLSGNPQNIAVSGNYAYVASSLDTQELQIINITNPAAPSLAGSYNAVGNSDGLGVYILGTTVYFVRPASGDNELFIINASNPSAPTLLGSLNLNTQGNEVFAMGNYAYVSSSLDAQELQVVNVTTPSSPTLAGFLNLTGNDDALTIAGFSNMVVVGRSNGDVTLINVTTPSSPSVISTYNAGDRVNDLALGNNNNYVFIACEATAGELKVLDITLPATPLLIGLYNNTDKLKGIAYHPMSDRAFATGEGNLEEVITFAPQ